MRLFENITRVKQIMGISESESSSKMDLEARKFYEYEVPQSTDVIEVANTWEGGGYEWAGGTGLGIPLMWTNPETNEEEVLKDKQKNGTYCSGYALQVGYIVAKNRGLLENKTKKELLDFIREWYQSYPKTCVQAITNLGIGVEVSLDDATAGDFCQLWRTGGSGHNVIFLSHIFDENDEVIGIKYRSTQKSTDGIGDNKEFFYGFKKGRVKKDMIYFARLNES